jgi:two-component system, LytTR family, response regulator
MITPTPVAMQYRAVIADDERIARAGLRAMLARYPQFEVVGEARDGEEAVDVIHHLRPDVAFLDVQMPGRDGFDVVRELAAVTRPPAYVLVSASAARALEAYEVDATDYLRKPFSDARLGRTIQRVVRHIRGARSSDRLVLHFSDGAAFVDVGDIHRAAVEGNYLRVYTGTSEHVVRRTMAELAYSLRGAGFVRINRSDLVNVARIHSITRRQGGRYHVVLEGGQWLVSSRRYQRDVRAVIAELG